MIRPAVRQRELAIGQEGFTLIELMTSLVVLALAGTFIYTVFITQHDSYLAQQDVTETQQDVRVSLDMLARDLRSGGYGLIGGGAAITATNDTNPDLITFQVAQGGSAYLTATPASSTINVSSTAGFTVGGQVNLVSVIDKTQLGAAMYTINTVSGTTQLVLAATPPTSVRVGDLVIGTTGAGADTITYSLAPDTSNPGTNFLQRCLLKAGAAPPCTAENLADHILDLQFQYTMCDGTVQNAVTAPETPSNVQLVQVTITSQTARNVAKAGANARTRQLSTFVRLKNGVSPSSCEVW